MPELKQEMMTGSVSFNRCLGDRLYHMAVRLPDLIPYPHPGQFVMIRPTSSEWPLLSRPFSIYRFSRTKDHATLEVLYRVVGRGTEILSFQKYGSRVSVLGPLGQGFLVDENCNFHILIAGGMGIAPISYLADHLRAILTSEKAMIACLGARSGVDLFGIEHLRQLDCSLNLVTEDGTMGVCGLVTDILPGVLRDCDPARTAIYACGPMGMLRSLADSLSAEENWKCQAAVEERMACGVGACLGCVLPVIDGRGCVVHKSVCKEGPVFKLQEIWWEGK